MRISWLILDNDGVPLTGGANSTSVKVRRISDGYLLDWDDHIFKNSNWVALTTPLSETDAINLQGWYEKEISGTGWQDGNYQYLTAFDNGTVKRFGASEVELIDGEEAELNLTPVLNALSALNDVSVAELLTSDLTDSLSFPANSLADLLRKIFWEICNKQVINWTTGALTGYKSDGATPAVDKTIVKGPVTTVRSEPEWR